MIVYNVREERKRETEEERGTAFCMFVPIMLLNYVLLCVLNKGFCVIV